MYSLGGESQVPAAAATTSNSHASGGELRVDLGLAIKEYGFSKVQSVSAERSISGWGSGDSITNIPWHRLAGRPDRHRGSGA